MGGIGNQLFQLNRAISLKLHGKNVEILHYGLFKKIINFIIGHSSHNDWIDIGSLCHSIDIRCKSISLFDFSKLILLFINKKIFSKSDFDTSLKNRLNSLNYYDIGYFQRKEQFLNEAQEILINKLLEILELNGKINKKRNINFHLRGGDFFYKENNIDILKKPNFTEIKKIIKNIKSKDVLINIVSDDKKILKNNIFNEFEINFISSSPKKDFLFLSRSDQMYVSQSSYSYWAFLLANKTRSCILLNKDSWIYSDLL